VVLTPMQTLGQTFKNFEATCIKCVVPISFCQCLWFRALLCDADSHADAGPGIKKLEATCIK